MPRTELKQRIRSTTNALAFQLAACDIATIEARELRTSGAAQPDSGSKPLAFLQDSRDRRWVFKATSPALAAAECSAYRLRLLGKRPTVPAGVIEFEMPGLGVQGGVLKPFVDFDSDDELSTDTQAWTDLQRAVMLREHAWEWWLADLDANAGQYALLGSERYPVKLDWDRAFTNLDLEPPTRFDKYKVILPNVRTFLYVDWLESKIDLEFSLLLEEARRIARLPAERVRHIVLDHAEIAGLDDDATRSVVRLILERQRRAPLEFERFVIALRRERRTLARSEKTDLAARLRSGGVRVWRHWQLMLDGLFRGPVGDVGRVMLRSWRAHAARVQARNA